MSNIDVMYSSKEEVWGTPQDFFNELNEEFHFNLDPCALPFNAKCEKYFTPEDDGLKQDWSGYRVFCNPPYGRKIKYWVEKCYNESKKDNTLVVMLIPARTDTSYFHEFIYHKAKDIRFVKGRLKFKKLDEEKSSPAPFPSMVVVF